MTYVKNGSIRELETLSFDDVLHINMNFVGFTTKDEYIRLFHKFTSMYVCVTDKNDPSYDQVKQKLKEILVLLHDKYEKRYNTTMSVNCKL